MLFSNTSLGGAYLVDLEAHGDARGFFARGFCSREFEARGLEPAIAQYNLSYNERRGTIRGLHFQLPPSAEAKFLRCIAGAVYDVIVDLRPESPTYLQHFGVELSARNRRALYVPEQFGHGYQALTDGAEVLYSVTHHYAPGLERGLRYDDPALGIAWPLPVGDISEKDAAWPLITTRPTAALPR